MTRSKSNDRFKKDLRTLPEESPEYWNEVLRREGLSMSAGSDRRLIHVGDGGQLERVEAAREEEATWGGRRVKPEGAQPE